jgi:Uncharacterized conserved protein
MPGVIEIAAFADELLRTREIPDYPNALNGLQVATNAEIVKVAAAVDFSTRAVEGARSAGANLLLVHHGAFWSGLTPLTGKRYRVMASVIEGGLGVYSSHLPLDCHPTIGNNVLLAKRLGLTPSTVFGNFNDVSIGVAGESNSPLTSLIATACEFAALHEGRVHATPHAGTQKIGRWAVCTGSGANTETLREAGERGINTLIVGEGPHWTAVHAEESGITLMYTGHYVSEILGVQALAAEIAKAFDIPWEFIGAPTGT